MTVPRWTPGPWAVGDHGTLSVAIRVRDDVNPSGQRILAWVHSKSGLPKHYDEAEFNARLIAAAPALAEACEALLTFHAKSRVAPLATAEDAMAAYERIVAKIRAALALANGGA